ncbi:hypothetical protein XBJ2_2030004 [Xenorhabdus bovienii str. Jollieti]|uniref:Uncharacterized protein n=1 Tax=Xenorhabdus bovienii (strain SS-2004) TaxID=406818 RepID=D3V615_XENBS|nr:hypothetical protein [Xenorhabdus bovienii]CBJ83094.1 hypothetical protein XBJ1_3976 [Xenorhabdus bovienii SS-2004]CDH28821.1 hypothetical protein XBJ2_2030004 [Xenorhabdus bovienii str. Jollieti]
MINRPTHTETLTTQNSLKLAERLQTYLFTWSASEKNKDTVHLIEMAIDTTNKIIDNLIKSTEVNDEQ